jgi:signal transduction histidine kinase
MIKTLRGKILLGIVLVVLGIYFVINIILWGVFERNLEKYIINDFDKIKSIVNTEIKQYTEKGEIRKYNENKVLPKLEEYSNTYSSYISIDKAGEDSILFSGKLVDITEKESIIKESNKKAVLVNISIRYKKLQATYAYPIYEEDSYVGTLILQKDYTEEYGSYKKIMTQIILVQAFFYLLMLGVIYIWLARTTDSLKKLAQGMNEIGKGDYTQELHIKGSDEISKLAYYFNRMQEKIVHQIEDIYTEKKKIENLEKETKNFFNYATHEMKTPLTAIRGYGELLEQDKLEEDTTKRIAGRIVLESERMHTLVKNMLVVAKGKEQIIEQQETFDVGGLLEEVIKDYEVILEKENKQISLEAAKCMIFAVKEEIRTILSNLIDNAIKYSNDQNISISSKDSNPNEIVFFNKIGLLPPEIKENLLKPFVKYNYQDYTKVSSGLGLFICSELAAKNNASLSYEIKGGNIYFVLNFKGSN